MQTFGCSKRGQELQWLTGCARPSHSEIAYMPLLALLAVGLALVLLLASFVLLAPLVGGTRVHRRSSAGHVDRAAELSQGGLVLAVSCGSVRSVCAP